MAFDPHKFAQAARDAGFSDDEIVSKIRAQSPAAPSSSGIGLSGPGSKDESPSDVITKPVPRGPSDIPADLASGAAQSVKSMGRGLSTLAGEVSPVNAEGVHVPFSGLMEGPKRRELERGVSDVATFGLAEKAAGKLFPDYAASAAPDAAAAPGYRDAGGVAGMALPNPVGEAVNVAGKVGREALGAAGAVAKLGGRKAGDAIEGVGERAMARSDARMHESLKEGGTPTQRGKLDEVGQADVDMVRKTPRLKAALGNAEKFHGALEETLSPIEATQKETLARAQMVAGAAPADVVEAELRRAQEKLGGDYSKEEVSKAIQEHIDKAAIRSVKGKSIDLEDLRAEKSRLQKIAFDKSPTAKTTEAQEAAGIAAGVIKDVLEKHIETALPGEGKAFAQRATDESVLLRMKAIAARNVANPRKGHGFADKLIHGITHSAAGAAVGVGTHSPGLGLAIAAAPTAVRYGFRGADEALAMLARSARSGKRPPAAMVQEAIAAGVKPSSAAAISDAVPIAVNEPGTVSIPNERMADIVPAGAGGEDLAAGQAKRATAPDDYEMLGATKRNVVAR